MEVHHHPDLHHKEKKWKEYFLEFLMIFLAVTMGFFAESLREHVNYNSREKEYIHSLIADLDVDKHSLDDHVHVLLNSIAMMDSLINMLDTPSLIKGNGGELYYLARLAPRVQNLSIDQKTFEQLKNAGNFRVVKSLEVSDKIMAYYERLAQIRLLETLYNSEFEEYKKAASKIFEPAVLKKMESADGGVGRTTEDYALRTNDPELLKELSFFAVYMNGSRTGLVAVENQFEVACNDLSSFLKKEYHLENE